MRKVKKSNTKAIVLQLLIAMPILTILLALLSAKLILSETIAEEQGQICVCVYTAVVSFAASVYCAARMPQKKLLWGMLSAVLYLCLLLVSNLLFFGIGFGSLFAVSACVLGAGLFGGLLGAGKRKKYA